VLDSTDNKYFWLILLLDRWEECALKMQQQKEAAAAAPLFAHRRICMQQRVYLSSET
jgi:hypothetical protein